MTPVVLVHGWGGSFRETWQRPGTADLLVDAGRQVIGVDLLGHGTAPKPHDPAAYVDLTARVVEAIDAEAGGGPVDAIGFSLGAITLLELARREPHRFAHLVLAGVGRNLFDDDRSATERIVAALEGSAVDPDADGPADNVARRFVDYAHHGGNDRVALTAVMKRPRGAALAPADLATVTVPTLVVIGDRDFAGPGDELVAALPDATLRVLRNVDHFATPESFGFIDAALEFIGAVPT